MFKKLLQSVIGDPNAREAKKLQPIVDQVNALEAEFEQLSREDLVALTGQFRERIATANREDKERLDELKRQVRQESDSNIRNQIEEEAKQLEKEVMAEDRAILDEIMPRAYAAVREAAKRTIGQRHFDVQIMGAIVLHRGEIAEMKTGEGKTLTATMPLYLNALTGRGAHLVTPNDYLSKIGVQWMGQVYHYLGLSTAVIQSIGNDPSMSSFLYDPDYVSADDRYQHLRPVSRREAYAADITYGTNNEFGFDYLRDNMAVDLSQLVQRELHYAIVDEIDNILIDEARTPLIISGPAEESTDQYMQFARLVRRLNAATDWTVDEKMRAVTLTEEGISRVESMLGISNLYSSDHFELTPYLENALKALVLFKNDVDYIVKDGQVIIVDEFTGRLMFGRRYSEGLHQAIEAKEGVKVQRESLTWATITFQNYFRMYKKLAGMTGTAATEAEEFDKIYKLSVMVMPTNKPMVRADHSDVVYKTEAAKFRAVVNEIEQCHQRGQPVLVGTVSIEKSETLSEMLRRRRIPHQVLNAKYHEQEAGIIAQAGASGAVTIATNMAGRGVDILLGGNAEGLARDKLRRQGKDLTQLEPGEWEAALAEATRICAEDHDQVVAAGGLHVIGTERHEARRIDNQLRGRSGRQGDPGASRFYVSMEDDLMRRFGGSTVANVMGRLGVDEDTPIEAGLISKSIESAQVRVEGFNFDIRKHVLEYDDVVNQQRELIYAQRQLVLREESLRPIITDMVEEELSELVATYAASESEQGQGWDAEGLYNAVRLVYPLPPTVSAKTWEGKPAAEVTQEVIGLAHQLYDMKERALGPEQMRQLERMAMLRVIDTLWVNHLTGLDELREGIGLRAYGQRDPLIEYKREAHDMFDSLTANIRRDIVHSIYFLNLIRQPVRRPVRVSGAAAGGASRPVRKAKVGRNDPCPCGSGKKYKNCCMLREGEEAAAAPASKSGAAQGGAAKPGAAKAKPRQRR
ncbi:MAG: preprotein translocase subunit SecA [Chloroflexi bacterium]|nr:preprotein translocase subunit SecA [Chloroflexota bacterium]